MQRENKQFKENGTKIVGGKVCTFSRIVRGVNQTIGSCIFYTKSYRDTEFYLIPLKRTNLRKQVKNRKIVMKVSDAFVNGVQKDPTPQAHSDSAILEAPPAGKSESAHFLYSIIVKGCI